jgi:hypothetical protein
MRQSLKADNGVSMDVPKNVPDECAFAQYPFEQPGGLLRISMHIDPDLSAMLKDSALFLVGVIVGGFVMARSSSSNSQEQLNIDLQRWIIHINLVLFPKEGD